MDTNTRVKTLFQERVQKGFFLWILLPPLFLIVSSALLFFHFPKEGIPLLLSLLVGTIAASMWGVKGFIATFPLIVGVGLFVPIERLWLIGWEGSVGISLFLGAIVFQDLRSFFEQVKKKKEEKERECAKLTALIRKEGEIAAEEKSRFSIILEEREKLVKKMEEEALCDKELIDTIQREVDSLKEQNQKFSEQLLVKRRKIAALEDDLHHPAPGALHVKVTKEEIEKPLAKQLEEMRGEIAKKNEQILSNKEELSRLNDELKEAYSFASSEKTLPEDGEKEVTVAYRQLRKQFNEKTEVLHLTRKKLFALNEELLTLEKEKENQEGERSEQERALLSHCQEVEKELQLMEELLSSMQGQ